MSALLGEPFLLANYPIPSRGISKPGVSEEKGDRHVRVTSSSCEQGEGVATVTVQGDGVHVLEVQSTCLYLKWT